MNRQRRGIGRHRRLDLYSPRYADRYRPHHDGIILTVLLSLVALRGVAMFLLGSLTGEDGAFLAGGVVGVVIVVLLLVLVINRLLVKGFAQRRAYQSSGGAAVTTVNGQNSN